MFLTERWFFNPVILPFLIQPLFSSHFSHEFESHTKILINLNVKKKRLSLKFIAVKLHDIYPHNVISNNLQNFLRNRVFNMEFFTESLFLRTCI